MKFSKKLSILVCSMLLCQGVSFAINGQVMNLYVGQSEFINDRSINSVAVGSSDILNATAVGNKGVLITGLKSGDTTIKVWRNNSVQTINTHVYPVNFNKIIKDIRFFMKKYPNTSVNIINDRIVVEGKDLDTLDKQNIDKFLSQFDYVVNLTSEKNLKPDLNDQRMIYFDVKILEVSANNMDNIGIQWENDVQGFRVGIAGEFKKSEFYKTNGGADIPVGNRIKPFASYASLISSISSRINLLESRGLAKMVAHPVLSCKNGGTASFLSGGQVPFSSASATGTPSVEFKDYGIRLDVSPVIQSDGSIVANITAEVSEVDHTTQIEGVGLGFLTRKTQTEFSLKNAETLILSGLNSTTVGTTNANVPGISKVPFVGALFRNKAKTNKKNELVFIVTPIIYSEDKLPVTQEIIKTVSDEVIQMNQGNKMLPKDFFNSEENRIYFNDNKNTTKIKLDMQ